jgi:hypothetical protein
VRNTVRVGLNGTGNMGAPAVCASSSVGLKRGQKLAVKQAGSRQS